MLGFPEHVGNFWQQNNYLSFLSGPIGVFATLISSLPLLSPLNFTHCIGFFFFLSLYRLNPDLIHRIHSILAVSRWNVRSAYPTLCCWPTFDLCSGFEDWVSVFVRVPNPVWTLTDHVWALGTYPLESFMEWTMLLSCQYTFLNVYSRLVSEPHFEDWGHWISSYAKPCFYLFF